MRIFKYWIRHQEELTIYGKKQLSSSMGGSNLSLEDAREDAKRKLAQAQAIIHDKSKKDPKYEADIVEEIIEELDLSNIVTRNRYGALVLNAKHLMFIDIDRFRKNIFQRLFQKDLSSKELLLRRIKKKTQKYPALAFRIYETFKGFRVLITNQGFSAQSRESSKLMKAFKADLTYQWLCERQNCFRARLTPKPHRIKQPPIKVIYPDRSPEDETNLQAWAAAYENQSRSYSTCKLVEQIGHITLHQAIIDYHDRMTGIHRNNPLA